jgi:Rps23 Pro-64 3,4-dihydroxylase Tpa1-like proline 4-hydroxylase
MDKKMKRNEIADLIVSRLEAAQETARLQWVQSGVINYFIVDDLLPVEVCSVITAAFPNGESMRVRKNLRELKYVAAQMNQYDPILEEALFAFQDTRVVELVQSITGLAALEPDDLLYAGGISMMAKGHFLNPHLDNSHDKERKRFRVLNLLFYVSPEWYLDDGGNLEIWPNGPKANQITIESKFNRLIVMVTNSKSWHSVSPVLADRNRTCVSNYYFSTKPAEEHEYFHVTTFRGRPEQGFRDLALRGDSALRMGIRKLFPKGVINTKHYYKK